MNLSCLAPGFHHRRFQSHSVGFEAFIWRGNAPGPVLLLNGATHGDEYEGPTILRQWVDRWQPRKLAGTVVVVPVLNEAAFFAGQRCHPIDGGNLARAFSGRANGSPTSRLAYLFENQLLAQCTHYVDIHSAGSSYELRPWVGYLTRDDTVGNAQSAMAACFDYFWCWAGPYLPGRTLSAAYTRKIPAIYVECHGAGGIVPHDLRALRRGIDRLLRWSGVVPGPTMKRCRQKVRLTRDAEEAHLQVHHPAPIDGLFAPQTSLGQRVKRGQSLGAVMSLNRTKNITIKAERGGRIVLMRRQRSVRRGDALFTLVPV